MPFIKIIYNINFNKLHQNPIIINFKNLKIMKTNLLTLILLFTTCYSYSQMDIVSPSGNDGVAIRLTNTNNYAWDIISESTNGWTHNNTLDFYNRNNPFILFQLYPDNHVNVNGLLNVDFKIRLHMNQTGTLGGANGYDFNPNTTYEGMLLEQVYSEGSGFYSDGDYAVIYSPGDQNRLLRVYDEDGMVEKWYLDGSGYAYTISDSTKKENIRNIENSLSQLRKIQGVKFNYKKEQDIEPTGVTAMNDILSKADSTWPGDIQYKDENKYDPSQKEYYGFLAQSVEMVYPSLISTNEKGEKFISYTEFIPILVQGYNEQTQIIENQQTEITQLTKKVEDLEKEIQNIYQILNNKK